MIKSFFLNNLLVPLRQVSPQMLLASATLHGLLFVAPIPFTSTDADVNAEDAANVSEAGIEEELFNEDGSITEKPELDSLGEGDTVTIPEEPPLLNDLEDGTNTNPDLALNESSQSGDSLGESDVSLNEPGISFNESQNNAAPLPDFPAETNNVSTSEPESQINFTPSEPVSQLVPEPINTVSEPEEIAQSESTDTTTQSQPEETSSEANSTTTESQPEEIAPSESTDTTTQSQSEETPSETNNTTELPVNPFADFPNYISVRPIFCGTQIARLDRRTRLTSDSLDAVAAYFENRLAATDFQVEKLTDEPDTKVYQVSKENLTQFLQLFATKEPGTMILLSSERVDCYRLSNQNLQENSQTEQQVFDVTFSNLYTQLGWTEEKDFAVTPEVEKVLGKDAKNTPEELALVIKSNLESEGFEASRIKKDEASELLYEIKKGEFIKYISFVPTKEGKGAIVLLLKNNPA
ncbi:hypothetical protein IQ247_08900 [Plectonema cf. radiosum LEGE 06105]|uniref:Uncharacterized protein n=1 Tax=Plectonema cf. radiosum LEGE 06105 TaxID=945769 RepID=A0A8J7F3T8_9CYAN|nr:hypothetical protein [Plectonema radiosum]MBE9212810.1 hypothetical protein [Plectonema cf. radiosum LEGE 06105]